MSKAERRKRARQRARERENTGGVVAGDAGAGEANVEAAPAVVPVAEAGASAEASGEPKESEFITGPISLPVPAPVRLARIELPADSPVRVPSAGEEEDDESEDADEDDAGDDSEEDEDDDVDDDADDGDESDDDTEDDTEDDIEDAVFNVACGAVEEGEAFSWNELIQGLCEVEVTDPRLGLLVALLVDQDDRGAPLPLSGARILKVLTDLGLGELVEEAREVATLAPGEEGESPEERAVVRTNARELKAQAEAELAGKKAPIGGTRPVKASQLRGSHTALGRAVPPPATTTPTATRRAGR